MTIQQTRNTRISRRSYNNRPLEVLQAEVVKNAIAAVNEKYRLHIQLVIGNGAAFSKLSKSYGLFSGVQNYIAMIGKTDAADFLERIGFAGEEIILTAVGEGLGTCWVGGSFDKKACRCELDEGESIVCLITVGEVLNSLSIKERLIRNVMHRSSKEIDDMITTDATLPPWVMKGMEGVRTAPSAVNKQPVKFNFSKGILTASVEKPDSYQAIDLGIAKYHFSLASEAGEFPFGNGAAFSLYDRSRR